MISPHLHPWEKGAYGIFCTFWDFYRIESNTSKSFQIWNFEVITSSKLCFSSFIVHLFQQEKCRVMHLQRQNNFYVKVTVTLNRNKCKLCTAHCNFYLLMDFLVGRYVVIWTHIKWYWPKRYRLSLRGQYHFSVSSVDFT